MNYKCLYHKSDDHGEFSGQEYYSDKSLQKGQKVFVISSKTIGGPPLTPFLEGEFVIAAVHSGGFNFGNDHKKNRYELKAVSHLDMKIDLSNSSIVSDRRAFKDRYMNQFIPDVPQSDLEEFKRLILEHQQKLFGDDDCHWNESVREDIKGLFQELNTEAEQMVLARLGQGKFRENVIKTWGYSGCAATSNPIKEFLTASHIVPWSECTGDDEWKRLDGANGILLCAHIDRLFDRHLISFKPARSGSDIRISSRLDLRGLAQVGITLDLKLEPNLMRYEDKERFLGYLNEHYERFLSVNE